MTQTHDPQVVAACSYTGIHFIKISVNEKTLTLSLEIDELSYETEQFVNQVIEYDTDKYLAASWDNNKYIFIDHRQEKITNVVTHPLPNQFSIRCWGLQKVGHYDSQTNPFIMARDNTGYVLINTRTFKAHMLAQSPITANLFGHGNILRIQCLSDQKSRILTVI